MTDLDQSTRISRAPAMIDADDGDEVLMLDPDTGRHIRLNPVAAEIWHLAAAPLTIAEVIAALLEMFDVEAEVCEREVFAFVRAAWDAGAIVVVDDTR
ncbi:MAG: PqqD family peptide modification chaperone [Pseudomonadota bacterium]|nr:PqqD family peptide modification chaperone [Pseudomonadota bacterium]